MNYLIFAFYDRDGIIDFHVLDSLQKYCNSFKIIFVSNVILSEKEKKKINFVRHIIEKEHNEKDFGSWKIGINFIKNKKINTLLLVNDSVIGPLKEFSEILSVMKKKECDFWGITAAGEGDTFHLQSYFLFFKKNVIRSKCFKNFFQNVKKVSSKSELVKLYEIGLTQQLINNGFKCSSFLHSFKKDIHSNVKFYSLIKTNKLPFLKVKNLVSNPFRLPRMSSVLKTVNSSDKLLNYVKRINRSKDISHLYYFLPQFKFNLISNKLILFRAKFVSNNRFWRFYVKFLSIYIFFIIFPVKSKSNTYKSDLNY